MRRDLRPIPVNGPVSLGDYTRPMTIKHILTAFTAVMAGAAAISLAPAQQAHSGAVGVDEANATALPPPGPARAPGPILSPDDPRYANAVPNGAVPTGPV